MKNKAYLPYPRRMFEKDNPANARLVLRAMSYCYIGYDGRKLKDQVDSLPPDVRNEVIRTYLRILITR